MPVTAVPIKLYGSHNSMMRLEIPTLGRICIPTSVGTIKFKNLLSNLQLILTIIFSVCDVSLKKMN